MNTLRLPAAQPDAIGQALRVLRAGGLAAFPTDTVYGLGALACDGPAVESIYAAKQRPVEKAIPVLIADLEDLDKVAAHIPDLAKKLAARFWPGPLTLVVPKEPTLPAAISASDTLAVRIPDHPAARALLRAAGPMAVTSANISGQPSPTDADEVLRQLNGRIPLVLDGGPTPGGIPSTLVDCLGAQPTLLRPGPLTLEQLLAALG
ncbi:MAG: L-threonylcarbamoyladenylate synthase [Chloroflexota bacterium]